MTVALAGLAWRCVSVCGAACLHHFLIQFINLDVLRAVRLVGTRARAPSASSTAWLLSSLAFSQHSGLQSNGQLIMRMSSNRKGRGEGEGAEAVRACAAPRRTIESTCHEALQHGQPQSRAPIHRLLRARTKRMRQGVVFGGHKHGFLPSTRLCCQRLRGEQHDQHLFCVSLPVSPLSGCSARRV